ncbi:Os04g0127700 [Oryza sativa Japonica Group]|uniref:Os04g0127700 protein n=1 Tax=Oryza sativa subsp. japonica TaxID=39947 RepID=A0A0P0W6E0_ORYSJ|nr:Os04g0127700 [Oryza sativa Japonica Group]
MGSSCAVVSCTHPQHAMRRVLTLSPLVSEDTCEAGKKAAKIRGGVEEANDSHNGVAQRRLASGGTGRRVPSPSCAAGVVLSPLVMEDTGEARDDGGGETRGDRRGCRRRREKREESAASARGEDRSGSGVVGGVAGGEGWGAISRSPIGAGAVRVGWEVGGIDPEPLDWAIERCILRVSA